MDTYLNSEEFAEAFFKIHEMKMLHNHHVTATDRIIYYMFCEYEKDVKETLEGALWGIEDFDGEEAFDLIGYQFHKSFRQTDVIPAKHIDGILWSCMQDAPIFWECMKQACKILTSKDAAELYNDNLLC